MRGSEQECAEVTAKTLLEPKVPKRAVGRPMKAPRRGKRAPLSLLVRPEIKRLVDQRATASGTTQSAQAEFLIEQGLVVRQVIEAMGKTLAEIERGNVHATLLRAGWTVERYTDPNDGKTWKAYREPGYPPIVREGTFVSGLEPQEGEAK
jgi:hypothetical protein